MNTKNEGRTIYAAVIGALAIGTLSVLWTGFLAKAAPASTAAPEVEIEALDTATLERAFWSCDYVATVHGPDRTPMAECSAATDRLKDERFAGDFGQMLDWWRQNKPAEHARMAAAMDRVAANSAAR